MNKSISSPSIVRVISNDSSRSAGAGCPCRSGRGSGGSPPRTVLKKVLLVVLSLSVFFSLLAVVPSALTAVYPSYIDFNPFGFDVITTGVSPLGDFTNLTESHYIPMGDNFISDNNELYNIEFYYYDNYGYSAVNFVQYSEDDVINNIYLSFDPIYLYNENPYSSNIVSIIDGLEDLYLSVSVNYSYELLVDVYYPDDTVDYDVLISEGDITTYNYAFGDDLTYYIDSNFTVDGLVPVPVEFDVHLNIVVDGLGEGEFFTVTGYYDDLGVGYIGGYTNAIKNWSYADGYQSGQSTGYEQGYSSGYQTGSYEGYTNGYNAGQSSAITTDGIGGMLSDAVGGFLDLDIFGTISIGDILLAVCGIALVVLFLKFFAGG